MYVLSFAALHTQDLHYILADDGEAWWSQEWPRLCLSHEALWASSGQKQCIA